MSRTFAVTIVMTSLACAAVAPAQDGTSVVIVLDDSGSMDERMPDRRTRKMDAAKSALLTVLGTLPDDATVGLFALNAGGPRGRGGELVAPGPPDRRALRQAVRDLRPSNGTPLGASIKQAADALLTARRERPYDTHRLLIVTDGEATDGDLVDRYLPDVLARGITVDVIGVAMPGDHSLATRVDSYRSADDPAGLERAVREVLAESTGGSSGDGTAGDYEFIAPLPDPVAAAMLAALGEPDDAPIGERPVREDVAIEDGAVRDGGAPRVFPADVVEVEGGSFFGGLMCCLGVPLAGMCVLVLAVVVLFGGGKPRRRR